jgi:uncharacterized protein (DUF1800 family)
VISAHRALRQVPDRPERIIALLTQLGQRAMSPGSPAGWLNRALVELERRGAAQGSLANRLRMLDFGL